MGILSNLFGKKKEEEVVISPPLQSIRSDDVNYTSTITPPMKPLDSSTKVELRKGLVKISLEKKGMQTVKARVAIVLDDSGSMSDMYDDGTVQEIVERVLPIGLKLDDNAELDVWTFGSSFRRYPSIKEKDFKNYVRKVIKPDYGGTDYSLVINDIIKKYVKQEPNTIPAFIIFITDGATGRQSEVTEALMEASKYNIFFQFVGIGNDGFTYLKSTKEIIGRKANNTNLIEINNVNNISDEQLYDMLFTAYPIWEKEAKAKGIVR